MAIDTISKVQEKEIIDRYNLQLYFILSISKDDKEILSNAADIQKFSQLVHQFAFGMGEKVIMTNMMKDTIPLLDAHYPRMYGMAPSTDILLIFKYENIEKAKILKIKIKDFGLQTGDMTFKFETKKITMIKKSKILLDKERIKKNLVNLEN